MSEYKTFDEIIRTVSDKTLEENHPSPKGTKDRLLSLTEKKDNIAFFSRMISNGYVGWNSISPLSKQDFEKGIEDIYNSPKQTTIRKMMSSLKVLTLKTIPDNHLKLWAPNNGNPKNTYIGIESLSAAQVSSLRDFAAKPETNENQKGIIDGLFTTPHDIGVNIASKEFLPACDEQVIAENDGTWRLTERDVNGSKVGIVGILDCDGSAISEGKWNNFPKVFEEKIGQWDSLIIDMRGNTGGSEIPIEFVSRTLMGHETSFGEVIKSRNTLEQDILKYKGGKLSAEELNAKKNHPRAEEFITEYQAVPIKQIEGYQRPIFVLMDRQVASAAETIFPMLKDHPEATFVGQNSAGTLQFGSITQINMPCGGALSIGTRLALFQKGLIEGIGHKPDIQVQSGKNALDVALQQISENKAVYTTPILHPDALKKETATFDYRNPLHMQLQTGFVQAKGNESLQNTYRSLCSACHLPLPPAAKEKTSLHQHITMRPSAPKNGSKQSDEKKKSDVIQIALKNKQTRR